MSPIRPTVCDLGWEGAAGRRPDRFLVIEVRSLKPERHGFLGLSRSPSFAGWMPDAQLLSARDLEGHAVTLRAPGGEVAGVKPGDLLVLGLKGERACLSVIAPPKGMAPDRMAAWAEGRA